MRYWKRMIEVTAELGCELMNSEFNGRPERAAESEAAFWRSLDELLPVFERAGIALNLEAHPDDFCEVNDPAVDLVRAINKPWVNYLYCAPHTFHLSGDDPGADVGRMLHYAGIQAGAPAHRGLVQPQGFLGPALHHEPAGHAARGSTSTSTSARARSTGTPSSAPCATSSSTA